MATHPDGAFVYVSDYQSPHLPVCICLFVTRLYIRLSVYLSKARVDVGTRTSNVTNSVILINGS